MIRIICIICFFFTCPLIYGQEGNIMNYVDIPEHLVTQLDSVYHVCTNEYKVGAGINIHNIIDYRDTSFKDGLYTFGGMGPHFQHMLFICNNKKIYIFDAHMAINVQKQLMDAKEKLRIDEEKYVLYLKLIADYIYKSYKFGDYYYETTDEDFHDGIIFTLEK